MYAASVIKEVYFEVFRNCLPYLGLSGVKAEHEQTKWLKVNVLVCEHANFRSIR